MAGQIDLTFEQRADVVDREPTAPSFGFDERRIGRPRGAAGKEVGIAFQVLIDAERKGKVISRASRNDSERRSPPAGSSSSPFATSWTVPSPPIATTPSQPSRAA
jgi:hypothetical protein